MSLGGPLKAANVGAITICSYRYDCCSCAFTASEAAVARGILPAVDEQYSTRTPLFRRRVSLLLSALCRVGRAELMEARCAEEDF